MNINQILNFNRGVAVLQFVSQTAPLLASDQTPMPDGQGTVASRFAELTVKLELAYLPIMEAAKKQGITEKTALPAETDLPVKAIVPQAPARETGSNLPAVRRKMAGS